MDLVGYEASNTAGSTVWLETAKRWLQTCLNEHKHCERPRATSRKDWKPSRLIHLSRVDGSLRLVEKDDIPSTVTYVTLSHSWGKIEDKLVLTKENIKQFKEKVPPFGQLKTFQDAVEITRFLGISYIWIDSLCIIQNSQADWRYEASLMSDVYKYALFNISATAATDDTGGCFSLQVPQPGWTPRQSSLRIQFGHSALGEPTPRGPSIIRVPTRGGSPKAMRGLYNLISEDIFRGWTWDVENGSVNKRGWVLQEVCPFHTASCRLKLI